MLRATGSATVSFVSIGAGAEALAKRKPASPRMRLHLFPDVFEVVRGRLQVASIIIDFAAGVSGVVNVRASRRRSPDCAVGCRRRVDSAVRAPCPSPAWNGQVAAGARPPPLLGGAAPTALDNRRYQATVTVCARLARRATFGERQPAPRRGRSVSSPSPDGR